jgi:hypothetical protein
MRPNRQADSQFFGPTHARGARALNLTNDIPVKIIVPNCLRAIFLFMECASKSLCPLRMNGEAGKSHEASERQ